MQDEVRIAACLQSGPGPQESRKKGPNCTAGVSTTPPPASPYRHDGRNLRAPLVCLGRLPRKSGVRPDRQKRAAGPYRRDTAGLIIPVSMPRQLVIGAFMNLRVAG